MALTRAVARTGLTIILFILFLCAGAHGYKMYQVLVINSLQQGVPWTQEQMKAFESVFMSSDMEIDLHIDYMHTKRIELSEEYIKFKYDTLSDEFRKLHFNVVICSGIDAMRFVLDSGGRLFPDTPIIFCGITSVNDPEIRKGNLHLGVYFDGTLERNIKLATELFPDTKKIVFVHDQTSGGLDIAAAAHQVAKEFPKLSFTFLTDMKMVDIQDYVRKLPSNAAVIPLAFNIDKSGEFFVSDTGIKMIASASSVPVFGLLDFEIDDGIFGGYLYSISDNSKKIAEMALRILKGEDIRNISPPKTSAQYMFNYAEMKRFGVSMSDLPNGSVIAHKPDSFLRDHRDVVIGAAIVLLSLLGTITILSINIIRRMRAEEALIKSEERYGRLFERSPDMVIVLKREQVIEANPAVFNVLGYNPEEIVGYTPWDVSPEYQPDGQLSTSSAKHHIDRAMEDGPQTFAWVHKRKDGSYVDCEVALVAYRVDDEMFVQAIVRDITERKRAEEERLALERQLDEHKRQFYRETILSVTGGKLDVCDESVIKTYISNAQLEVNIDDGHQLSETRHKIMQFCIDNGIEKDKADLFVIGIGEAITNAIKHGIDAKVYAGVNDDGVWVGVSDKGPGIESLILPHAVLVRGYSTKPSMGLGYSIMLDVADRILLSTSNKGTTVILIKNRIENAPDMSIERLPDTWGSIPAEDM